MRKHYYTILMCIVGLLVGVGLSGSVTYGAGGSISIVDKDVDTATPTDSSEETTETSTEEGTTEKPSTGGNPSSPSEGRTVITGTVNYNGLTIFNNEAIAGLTEQYNKTQEEKREVQQNLNMMLTNQNDFIELLHELDDMIIEYQEKLDVLEEKKEIAGNTAIALQDSLEKAQLEEDAQMEKVKSHIKSEYENGTYTYMDALFNAVDYTDIVNKTEYINAVDKYDEDLLANLREKRQLIADKKALLEMLTSDIGTLQQAYEEEQDTIELLSTTKEEQIKKYQKEIDSKKAELAAIEALERQQTAQISQIESSYRAQLFSMNVVARQYNGDKFLWPMPAGTEISSYYGPRVAPTAGATTYHRGIDIPCPEGSEVIAVAPGQVIYVGYLGNGGNAVIVDHGSGISTCYFHLSSFNCAVGQSVTAGQVIALSGNTGVSTGPHLHFAVRVDGEYVNPLSYYDNISQPADSGSESGGNTPAPETPEEPTTEESTTEQQSSNTE